MTVREYDKMDEDLDDLYERKDRKKKKDKKRTHKQTSDKEEFAKESFKKMREELDEMRRREEERTRELDSLKRKIVEQEKVKINSVDQPEYEFGFRKDEYLKKGFIESAKWIKVELSKMVTEKMQQEPHKKRFEVLMLAKKKSNYLGIRTCARYNRDEPCNQGTWHTTHKQDALWTRHGPMNQQDGDPSPSSYDRDINGRRNEIRLHACTLCFEAMGAAYGHGVLDCPWIQKKNWMNEDK